MRWMVTVYASDYETSKEFYRDTLGMFVEQTGPDSLVARRDGVEIRVDGGAKKRKRKRGWMQESGIYLTLETPSFDDLYGELQRRGPGHTREDRQLERRRQQAVALAPEHIRRRSFEHGPVVSDEQRVVRAGRDRGVLSPHVLGVAHRLRSCERSGRPVHDGQPQAPLA